MAPQEVWFVGGVEVVVLSWRTAMGEAEENGRRRAARAVVSVVVSIFEWLVLGGEAEFGGEVEVDGDGGGCDRGGSR